MSAPGHGSAGRVRWAAYSAVCLAAMVLAGFGGFLFGGARAASPNDAQRVQDAARRDSEARAHRLAYAESRERGRRNGLREGKRAGRRDAKEEVEGRAAQAAPPAQAEPEADRNDGDSDCPPGEQPITRMGVTYCGRPGPARPEDCPSGSEPVGETGACAPTEDSTEAERSP